MLAAFARSVKINVSGGLSCEMSEKTKEIKDQRAPVTRYCQIKGLRSLDMKYYLVAGGLPSVVEPLIITIVALETT